MERSIQGVADVQAITDLVHESHLLVDTGRWSELTETVFVSEADGLVPEANFGFATWRGTEALRAGFAGSMPRFSAAAHVVTNMQISLEETGAVARYYVQGWHWFAPEPTPATTPEPTGVGTDVPNGAGNAERNADFMVLGIMTDELVRQHDQWRILRRRMQRVGPGMAVGGTRPWLQGLGVAAEPG